MTGKLELSAIGIQFVIALAQQKELTEREALHIARQVHKSSNCRLPPSIYTYVVQEIAQVRRALRADGIEMPHKKIRAPGWSLPKEARERLNTLLHTQGLA